MQKRLFLALTLVPLVAACGADSRGPTAPTAITVATPITPTVATIVISLPAQLIAGSAQQATATAILTTGASQSAVGSWASDNPSIASVDGNGRVTPVANGRTMIRLASGGVFGSQEVRVYPNYQGRWTGQHEVVGCAQTGFYARENRCGRSWPNGTAISTTISLTQSTASLVTGTAMLGGLQSATFTAPIESDGAITFVASIVNIVSGGIAISGSWRVNSLTIGTLVGGVNQHWLNVGEFVGTGDMRIASEFRNMRLQ